MHSTHTHCTHIFSHTNNTQIDNREKRAVFSLNVVKRAMRHLPYSSILMTDTILEISKRYMEVGPDRASILHIGYDSLQNESLKSHAEEKYIIHPMLRFMVLTQGHNKLTFIPVHLLHLTQFAYICLHIHAHGATLVSVLSLMLNILLFIVSALIALDEIDWERRGICASRLPLEDSYYCVSARPFVSTCMWAPC